MTGAAFASATRNRPSACRRCNLRVRRGFARFHDRPGPWPGSSFERVQFGVVAEDALLIERQAPLAAQIGRHARQRGHAVVERHDLLVVSDEIYERLVYGGHEHVPFSALPGMRERTVVLAYHLEQAHGYRGELEMQGEVTDALAARAAVIVYHVAVTTVDDYPTRREPHRRAHIERRSRRRTRPPRHR